ncbi:hypothetical protein CSUI_009316 [Cystoisospora suis]|uniref:Uncharacterized protein n=1 Tax=Cystoisospora suis TaxID=483139 RepID=A0A2C6KJQ1_9APIC|nr:hypothetical protein CSUI_009316 [Cystoisospora suis]
MAGALQEFGSCLLSLPYMARSTSKSSIYSVAELLSFPTDHPGRSSTSADPGGLSSCFSAYVRYVLPLYSKLPLSFRAAQSALQAVIFGPSEEPSAPTFDLGAFLCTRWSVLLLLVGLSFAFAISSCRMGAGCAMQALTQYFPQSVTARGPPEFRNSVPGMGTQMRRVLCSRRKTATRGISNVHTTCLPVCRQRTRSTVKKTEGTLVSSLFDFLWQCLTQAACVCVHFPSHGTRGASQRTTRAEALKQLVNSALSRAMNFSRADRYRMPGYGPRN